MSRFLCKTVLLVGRSSVRPLAKTCNVNLCSLRWFSVSSERNKKRSFTASYLINTLGFSEKSALSASKAIKLYGPDKPDKAVEFLRNFGFTPSQITRLVRSFPQILVMNTEKTILPKIEFLLSKGISRPELARPLSIFPTVLRCHLGNQIIPSYEYMRALIGSEAKTVVAVRRYPNILAYNIEKIVKPNIATLRGYGVSISSIASLINRWPQLVAMRPVQLREGVREAVQMGFDASKLTFLVAVGPLSQKTKLDRRVSLYKKWGWSNGEVSEVFLRNPWCMVTSEEKITMVMDFLITEMGFQPRDVAEFPAVFSYSLKKRVVPRASFYGALLSKGLVKKPVVMTTLIVTSEKKFVERFVMPYVDESPELLKLYNEVFGLSGKPEYSTVSK